MKIAYLINQYPKISHSFIRREILALEALGVPITRFSIRACQEPLIDKADKEELAKTNIILDVGIIGLLISFLKVAITRPKRWLEALQLTIKIGLNSDRGLILNLAYLAEACVLVERFSYLEISHFHAHFGTNSTTVLLLNNVLSGVSYSFTVHGPEEFDKVEAIALPEKIKRAAFVVAISSYGKSQLYRWCEFKDWDKIKIVHCGVDDAFLSFSYQPMPEKPCFVSLGRLSEQKGQYLLIEAASKLVGEGYDFKLILVGDGELRQPIEESINRFNLEDTVEITGWATQAQVQKYILQSQVMVLPSFAEGLPVVIMESLALGRPVISTYIAGIPELVIPGESGWLVPAGSVEALVSTMKTVLDTPISELKNMGKIGIKLVKENHNVTQEAQKLKLLFESIH
ncbi:glycosyl transferase, group 1 [Crocosphaera subtropica ATCC 51142]|uniref:Glycosyl transferase, group 1 n=1 Tax=Crocosphaera subtropica (strain ATCC 51142 / BH68) TaxID=43989 RepID=B1X0I2_CROS5|nr:glycosyltransferase [Crocosphaera subtropica]ACB51271.1 glycosyl transferase, group 1 [Crocosphaera subtropica ATCC 51142]